LTERNISKLDVEYYVENGKVLKQSGRNYAFVTEKGMAVLSDDGVLITSYSSEYYDETMKEALKIIDGKAETECSGNVTAENVAKLAALGVNYISSGALTHSAPILDISMKNMHLEEICKV